MVALPPQSPVRSDRVMDGSERQMSHGVKLWAGLVRGLEGVCVLNLKDLSA